MESSSTKTSLPASTMRRQRSIMKRDRRTCVSKSWSLDDATTSAFTERWKSVTSTGRKKLGPARLGALGLGEGLWKFDANVIDGTVNGAGWSTRMSGTVSTWWDKWIIDGLFVNGVAVLTRLASYPVRLIQWGLVQWYALVMVAGLVCFIFYYVVKW